MNRLDEQYRAMLGEILYNGTPKNDRTGTGTLSKFGMSIRHRMSDGFPILTTKKIAFKSLITELKWFLKGDTNIKYLIDNNCNIWNGDAYKVYKRACDWELDEALPMDKFIERIKTDDQFRKTWGELGPIYGKQWRNWDGEDQIANLIKNLKDNPNSRRHIVSAWNVEELYLMTLPPCHYGFQCYVVDNKLSLMWQQRSADLFLGVPFNISSYGLLLLLLCEETGYEAGDLIGNFGDVHLYNNHLEQAKEQISRKPYDLPTFRLSNVDVLEGDFDIELIGYKSHPTIKAPLSN
jgi:thymidylate synthase